MMTSKHAGAAIAVLLGMAVTLSGCASSGVSTSNYASTENITPIQNTPVASSNLPALGDGQVQPGSLSAPASLNPGQPGALNPGQPAVPAPAGGAQVASSDGSFVSLNSVGSVPATPGRDLSTGLSIEKLLGGWTVVAGAEQCKLNLTYTAKTGTSRYRASTPGCPVAGLAVVASWQLVGSQVQLFDENGDIIASLILSGNRFIGTLAGGQGISMVG